MLTQRQLTLFQQILVRHQSHELSGAVERALAQLDFSSVGRALRRIEDGTYGRCTACGGNMGYLMLVANPVAELCPDCQGGYRGLRPGPALVGAASLE